jgi:hypothetical protein
MNVSCPPKEAIMTRTLVGTLAIGALTLLFPAVGNAQTRIDVGVWTPGGGGRVVIGGPPVYRSRGPVYVPARPVYVDRRPVYVVPQYRHDRGKHKGWAKHGRGPYGPGWTADSRSYRRDVTRAEAEYRRNVDRAEREYYDDLRDASRDGRRGRRW